MSRPPVRLAFRLCALAAAALTGCSTVTVKKPAGDSIAKLDPEIWEGTWRGAENFRGVSTIKDQAKGLVEFRSLDPKEKKDTILLTIRELKDRRVGSAVGKQNEESTAFFRIAATKGQIAVFSPRLDLFKEAVASGKVAGEIRKSTGNIAKGESTPAQEIVILNQFGAAEVEQMPPSAKGNAAACFEADPDMVLVREKAPVQPKEPQKKPKRRQ